MDKGMSMGKSNCHFSSSLLELAAQPPSAPSDEGAVKLPKLGNLTEGEKYEKQPKMTVFSLPQSKIGCEEPIFAT